MIMSTIIRKAFVQTFNNPMLAHRKDDVINKTVIACRNIVYDSTFNLLHYFSFVIMQQR